MKNAFLSYLVGAAIYPGCAAGEEGGLFIERCLQAIKGYQSAEQVAQYDYAKQISTAGGTFTSVYLKSEQRPEHRFGGCVFYGPTVVSLGFLDAGGERQETFDQDRLDQLEEFLGSEPRSEEESEVLRKRKNSWRRQKASD